MKFPLGDEDTPWLLFLLAAAILVLALFAGNLHAKQTPPSGAIMMQK